MKKKQTHKEWEQKIRKADVLVFDLDGTLINTDYANFLSYKTAIEQILHPRLNLTFNPSERVTREVIRMFAPNISEESFKNIIKMKESLYLNYLHETKLNREIVDILDKFTHKYYGENMIGINKFQHVLSVLHVSGSAVVVFEDSESAMEVAISAGIPSKNILKVVKNV